MTAKEIERLQYASSAQNEAADRWYQRFAVFADSHPLLAEQVWHRLHTHDVWYRARQRWLDYVTP